MPIRKALFSKPAWAAKSPEPFEDDRPTSIFQQNVYEDILQEKRKKEERRAAKERNGGQKSRRNESGSCETKSDDDRSVKKRRISRTSVDLQDDEDEDDDIDGLGSGTDTDRGSPKSEHNHRQKTPTLPLSPDKPGSRNTKGTSKAQPDDSKKALPPEVSAEVIAIGSDEDDELEIVETGPASSTRSQPAPIKAKSKPIPPPPPPPESESDSDPDEDEYVKELKRKAREEAKAKNRETAVSTTNTNSPSDTLLSPTANPTQIEPQVHIYINSILPNCPPIGIIRRPSQTLESVHSYFCNTHKLGDLLRTKVFFTWNNQRLFSSTTTKSILDQIRRKHGGIDKSDGKIVLEAVTDEILEYRLKQKEQARQRAAAGEQDEGYADNETNGTNGVPPAIDAKGVPVPENESAPTTSNGVVLKLSSASPDLPQMSLRVHADTTIDRIVRGYKRKMKLDMEMEVYLVFEGDRLDGESTVQDAGFEDGDCVDVRSK